jgi:AcrR family transcriptional regulator
MSKKLLTPVKQDTRERIKRRFLELYKKTSLENIKVSDIIGSLGLARGTFYYHFEDVYSLYGECELDMIHVLESGLDELLVSTVRKDHGEHVKIYKAYLKKYVENRGLLKFFLTGSEGRLFKDVLYESMKRNFNRVLEFSHIPSLQKRKALSIFHSGGLLALLCDWVLNDCSERLEDIAAILVQILYQGIYR